MILLIPAALFALFAQFRVKSTYARYSRVAAANGRTGREIAEFLLSRHGIGGVGVVRGQGFLGDHYNPMKKVVALSPQNHDGRSIAAAAIAAHEVGHAIQHSKGYAPLRFRHAILPITNLGSMLAFPVFIAGFFFVQGAGGKTLMDVGIMLFSLAVVFQAVTLPVEFNASSRAMNALRSNGILAASEIKAGRQVLSAAALTYVAAMAVTLTHLLRMVLLRGSRD